MSGEETPAPAMELPVEELVAIAEQAKVGAISAEQYAKLTAMIYTFALLKEELASKKTSIERLKRMLFGARTEKSREVLSAQSTQVDRAAGVSADREADVARESDDQSHAGIQGKGHGRNGAADYPGADKVKCRHPSLEHGDLCPGCGDGKVHPLEEAVRVRFRGMAPLRATVYECTRLRCALCGEVFTAPTPSGVGDEKYDETAPAVVGLLRYGVGLPFNRIEKLQGNFGIPLPASTQWELVQAAEVTWRPVYEEHVRQGADGVVVHNDDTTMKVLNLTPEQRAAALGEEVAKKRTGVFTSGIVSVGERYRIALFFTGARHAGENLTEVLKRRTQGLPPPIHMCDGLDTNLPQEFETLLCRCTAHARRHFVEVAASFPEEVRVVLLTLREVYKVDAAARKQGLSPKERLKLHQDESGPRMRQMREWMLALIADRRIEPNSGLGGAIEYMDKNWEGLTQFLQVEGAPLDNNITERALKRAIQHRKNSLFYKTLNGARVGDAFMTLIHTAELNGINAFDYLVALLRHPRQIAECPSEWMPWTYRTTLARLAGGPDPPA